MPKLNENYQNVKDSYLFAEIARRVKVYEETHPEKAADIIRLGIGDVTLPLTKSVIEALHEAVDSQAVSETFKGYGPEQGYAFAQEAIADYYARNGVEVKVSLFQMAQRVIQEILQSFLQRITWFSFRIRFTLFM
mgnify:CR=1 FL=1